MGLSVWAGAAWAAFLIGVMSDGTDIEIGRPRFGSLVEITEIAVPEDIERLRGRFESG